MAYLSTFLDAGIAGIIGKGDLPATIAQFAERKAIYVAAIGGLGAVLGKTVQSATVVAFDDLGPEAIFRLEIEKFPAVVIVDAAGQNFHAMSRDAWQGRD